MHERELFRQAAEHAADFVETLETRPIRAEADVEELTSSLGGPLPDGPTDPRAVIASLVEKVEPGLCATPSGRFFGFVIGGAVPAAVAADMLTSAWDQNAGLYVAGPSSRRYAGGGLPSSSGCRPTDWQGEHAMRVSVSNWRTTREDVERSAAAVLAAASVPA